MKYKNLNSGIVLDFPCEVAGGGWVRFVPEKGRAATQAAPAAKQEKEKTQAPRKRGKKLQ